MGGGCFSWHILFHYSAGAEPFLSCKGSQTIRSRLIKCRPTSCFGRVSSLWECSQHTPRRSSLQPTGQKTLRQQTQPRKYRLAMFHSQDIINVLVIFFFHQQRIYQNTAWFPSKLWPSLSCLTFFFPGSGQRFHWLHSWLFRLLCSTLSPGSEEFREANAVNGGAGVKALAASDLLWNSPHPSEPQRLPSQLTANLTVL